MRSQAARDRLRCAFLTVALCYGLIVVCALAYQDWWSAGALGAVVAVSLVMRRLVNADDAPVTDPEDDLVSCVCKGVDEYNRRHPELTVFETLNALSRVSDMLTKVFIEQGEQES